MLNEDEKRPGLKIACEDPQAGVVLAMDVSFSETEECSMLGFFLPQPPAGSAGDGLKDWDLGVNLERWISRQRVGEKVKETTYCITLCTLLFSSTHISIKWQCILYAFFL